MNCQSYKCKQGRKPCADPRCHAPIPAGGPRDWINELLDRGALVLAAIAIVAVAALATKFFN
jgi:hypothetical protein